MRCSRALASGNCENKAKAAARAEKKHYAKLSLCLTTCILLRSIWMILDRCVDMASLTALMGFDCTVAP
jgi:hypothetical protein